MGIFNYERIMICSPKALGEVLVKKNDDFIKPTNVRQSLSRILGEGVLLAEGEEHKVSVHAKSSPILSPLPIN